MSFRSIVIVLMVLGTCNAMAQDTRAQQRAKTNELFKERSVVERFDHTFLETEDQKKEKRRTQEAQREQLLAYLDTVSISQSLRRNLLLDMDNNPFSGRFRKFVARFKKAVLAKDTSGPDYGKEKK